MAGDLGCAVADLLRDGGLRGRIAPARYVDERVGLPTLTDILAELERPGATRARGSKRSPSLKASTSSRTSRRA